METQKTSNSQSSLEKEEWSWRNQSSWLQIILQSYSHQDKSKQQWDITSHQSEWPSSKRLQTINAGESVEKREISCTVGGNVNRYSHYWRRYGDSLKKLGIKPPYDPTIPLLGIYRGNQGWKSHVYPTVHCSTIYNRYNMEASPSTDEWIKLRYIHTMDYYSAIKGMHLSQFWWGGWP